MALESVLCGLVWTHFGWQFVHFSITPSMMFVNEGCHVPSSTNIVLNGLICMWPCVTCMFLMYSLFVTTDVRYVLCWGDVYWFPSIGGMLLPKMKWNIICSGLSPVTFTVNSLITCASTFLETHVCLWHRHLQFLLPCECSILLTILQLMLLL